MGEHWNKDLEQWKDPKYYWKPNLGYPGRKDLVNVDHIEVGNLIKYIAPT